MDNEVIVAFYDKFKQMAEEKTVGQIAEQFKTSSDWQIKRLSDNSIVLELKDFSVNGVGVNFRVQITKGLTNHVLVKWYEGGQE